MPTISSAAPDAETSARSSRRPHALSHASTPSSGSSGVQPG